MSPKNVTDKHTDKTIFRWDPKGPFKGPLRGYLLTAVSRERLNRFSIWKVRWNRAGSRGSNARFWSKNGWAVQKIQTKQDTKTRCWDFAPYSLVFATTTKKSNNTKKRCAAPRFQEENCCRLQYLFNWKPFNLVAIRKVLTNTLETKTHKNSWCVSPSSF